jgi:hypothetical protein
MLSHLSVNLWDKLWEPARVMVCGLSDWVLHTRTWTPSYANPYSISTDSVPGQPRESNHRQRRSDNPILALVSCHASPQDRHWRASYWATQVGEELIEAMTPFGCGCLDKASWLVDYLLFTISFSPNDCALLENGIGSSMECLLPGKTQEATVP